VDRAGNVYVADTFNHRVQVFTSSGVFLREWGQQGRGQGQLDMPQGIAVDGSGKVYVADTFNDRVQVFSTDGTFLGRWGEGGSGEGEFAGPRGMWVLCTVFVALPFLRLGDSDSLR
jgi:tripartite motif-containing protein 71